MAVNGSSHHDILAEAITVSGTGLCIEMAMQGPLFKN